MGLGKRHRQTLSLRDSVKSSQDFTSAPPPFLRGNTFLEPGRVSERFCGRYFMLGAAHNHYFKYLSSHSRNVLYHNWLLAGLVIQ